ncbi:MAG: SUMF1/EgtB/PvdO family nonheme iron enzyme [Spirochaetales bacterium]|nr:SUMF1/EgtB/PvdO family nonheme iron enzyme [Spirochaetales bacterium]
MKKFPALLLFIVVSASAWSQSHQSRGLGVIRETDIRNTAGNSGKRYAVCIGINQYEHSVIQNLNNARNDALALGRIFENEGQFDQVFIMTDDIDPRSDSQNNYPRLRNIEGRLDYLKDFINPEDLVVVSFSGHGISNEEGEGYLIVADSDVNDIYNTSFPISRLVDWVDELKVEKSLFLIDACRETISSQASRSLTRNTLTSQRYTGSKLGAIFYSTKTGWLSYEDQESDYGVFTRFLLEGLKGKADYQYGDSDSIVTFRELSVFVEEAVSNYSMTLGLKQKPFTDVHGELSGDIGISSYSASIDIQTRSNVEEGLEENRDVFGLLSLFSNVKGTVLIDGMDMGEIDAGETVIYEDIYAGSHFVEIQHEYGRFRNEFGIKEDETSEIANVVVLGDQDIKRVHGINFVYIKGRGSMPGFWMSDAEVTMGQYADFIERSEYKTVNDWDQYYEEGYYYYPAHNVSKIDAQEFCKWFSKRFRVSVSLPTLQQWQYAAGGKYGTKYSWGNHWDVKNCQNSSSRQPGVLPVIGTQGPTQIQDFQRDITLDGLTNMAGNMREWCRDEYTNSDGTVIGTIAGGSWKMSRSRNFQSMYTGKKPAHQADVDLGFRLILEP